MSSAAGCGPGEERCEIVTGEIYAPMFNRILWCRRHAAAPLLVEALKRDAHCTCAGTELQVMGGCISCAALAAAGEPT